MALEVVRSRASDRDLERIFDHLVDAAQGPGRAPFQGTLRPDLLPGLRQVTKDRAISYFLVDEPACLIRVLAVFFAGQDHHGRIRQRLDD